MENLILLCGYEEWSEWSFIGSCSRGCLKRAFRVCKGNGCEGARYKTEHCNTPPCPGGGGSVGHWSSWSEWGQCSKTCGRGLQERRRQCSRGNGRCNGQSLGNRSCFVKECPVDGQWSAWVNHSNCSEPCGGLGKRDEIRFCNNPAPENGGRDCEGDHIRLIHCNLQACKVDGQWSAWINIEECSETCGGGRQRQTRACTNPAPENGGKQCTGETSRVIDCNSQPCKAECEKREDFDRIFVMTYYSGICQTHDTVEQCLSKAYIYKDESNNPEATIEIKGVSHVLKDGRTYKDYCTFSLRNFTLTVNETVAEIFDWF
ncbi:hypothetical protein FSP39_012576 [Pinctada imbricata]|uniref:Uncharacterized protein n=1 Tax=Pinctada imbricata TaxID=66713 RepID=A0AA88XWL7_PINIB|nr:hypothetical protein FSP39_012576 [Pinctada imbricata]